MYGDPPLARWLDRRAFLRVAAGSTAGLALARCGGSAPSVAPEAPAALVALSPEPAVVPSGVVGAPPARPNVLVITVDTWRADHASSYGGATLTPYTDRVAAEGVRFANAYVQLPQTTPSHAALFTGQYPATNGVRISQHHRLAAEATTLARTLAGQNYRTAGLYSWYSLDGPLLGLDQGFQTYENLNVRVGTRDVLPPGAVAAARARGETPELLADARADVTTDAAIAWLEDAARDRSRPFFLWVHYRDPHYPYEPPSPFDAQYAPPCAGCADGSFTTLGRIWDGWQPGPADLARIRAAYAGEVAFTDSELGRLLGRLNALTLTPDTLIVLTADHGEAFGEHSEWFHGYKVHQSTIHVPLVMRLPGVLPAGATVRAAAQSVDVMPTVLELVGLSTPSSVEGRSLTPLIHGIDTREPVAFAEVADRRYYAAVAGDWKLIRDNAAGQSTLYDLGADPTEQRDVLAANRSVAGNLGRALDDWLAGRAAG